MLVEDLGLASDALSGRASGPTASVVIRSQVTHNKPQFVVGKSLAGTTSGPCSSVDTVRPA